MVTRYAYELNKFTEQLKVELKQSITTDFPLTSAQ